MDCTTLASVTSDLDTANTDIAALKNQPKNSKQPWRQGQKQIQACKFTSEPMVFNVGRSTPVNPTSGRSKFIKKFNQDKTNGRDLKRMTLETDHRDS